MGTYRSKKSNADKKIKKKKKTPPPPPKKKKQPPPPTNQTNRPPPPPNTTPHTTPHQKTTTKKLVACFFKACTERVHSYVHTDLGERTRVRSLRQVSHVRGQTAVIHLLPATVTTRQLVLHQLGHAHDHFAVFDFLLFRLKGEMLGLSFSFDIG